MDAPVYRVDLDLRQNDSQKFINVRKEDRGSKIVIRLREGGEPYPLPDDANVRGEWIDGTDTAHYSDCEIVDGCAVYTVESSLTANAGVVPLRVAFGDGEIFASTLTVFVVVFDDF